MSMKTNTYEINYKAYQPCILLDFSFSFEKDIPHDDICRTCYDDHGKAEYWQVC